MRGDQAFDGFTSFTDLPSGIYPSRIVQESAASSNDRRLLGSYEAKGICALLSFVLVGPNLGKVLFVVERYCQTGVVPVIRRFHPRDA